MESLARRAAMIFISSDGSWQFLAASHPLSPEGVPAFLSMGGMASRA
jgi:hypothetical protein